MRRVWKRFGIIASSTILLPLTACSDAQPPEQQARARGTIPNSVAVLPFESDTPELADVATGVYEEALNQLALVPDLYVVGREAMLPYSSLNLVPEEIALQLGVGYVVEGFIHYDDTTATGKVLSAGVTVLYAHTGEPSVSQGSGRRIQDSADVTAFQSWMATAMAATVQEIVLPRD